MRVYQCDRCGAIIKETDSRIEINFCRYEDGLYADSKSKQRDLCKKCADRMLREASGEPVGPQPMINANRLIDKIVDGCYRVTRYGENREVLGMTVSDITTLIREELSEENDDE